MSQNLSIIESGKLGTDWLFSEEDFPERPDLVELVKRGFNHTGERVFSRDEELCRRVVADLLANHLSQRAIARLHGISRQSIAGIYEQLESRNLVEPLRKAIKAKLARNIIMMVEDIGAALAQGLMHPNQMSVPLGIHLQQFIALEAGNPLESPTGPAVKELQVDQVREALEKMKRAKPVDDGSTHSESVV